MQSSYHTLSDEIIAMKLPFSSTSSTAVDTTAAIETSMMPVCDIDDEPLSMISMLTVVDNHLGNSLDILNSVEGTLGVHDDTAADQLLEPTPITRDSNKLRVVPQVSLQENPVFRSNDDITFDLINLLLSKQPRGETGTTFSRSSSSVSMAAKRPRGDLPSDIGSYIALQPLPKKLRTVSDDEASEEEQSLPSFSDDKMHRFRAYQAEQWWDRLQDMTVFKRNYGHCCVPNMFPPNPNLAQWVKRQRYQYKLKHEGKHSTLTDEREMILQEMNFIWDSHGAAWLERWNELAEFHSENGHSNVPTNYPQNKQLSVWVKCQRRQYKLYVAGTRSNMTPERINKLESLGFVWNPRRRAKITTTTLPSLH